MSTTVVINERIPICFPSQTHFRLLAWVRSSESTDDTYLIVCSGYLSAVSEGRTVRLFGISGNLLSRCAFASAVVCFERGPTMCQETQVPLFETVEL